MKAQPAYQSNDPRRPNSKGPLQSGGQFVVSPDRHDPSARLRLSAVGQIWRTNAGGRRYLTLSCSSAGCPLYLGT